MLPDIFFPLIFSGWARDYLAG